MSDTYINNSIIKISNKIESKSTKRKRLVGKWKYSTNLFTKKNYSQFFSDMREFFFKKREKKREKKN